MGMKVSRVPAGPGLQRGARTAETSRQTDRQAIRNAHRHVRHTDQHRPIAGNRWSRQVAVARRRRIDVNVRVMVFAPTEQPIGGSHTNIELNGTAIAVVLEVDIDLTSSRRHDERVLDGLAAVRRGDDACAINLDWERWRVSRWRDYRR